MCVVLSPSRSLPLRQKHGAVQRASLHGLDRLYGRAPRAASSTTEGESLALKVALIEATERWEMLTEDVRETKELDAKLRDAD